MLLKSIEQVPMFTTSLRIMKFWAFLLAHNWRRYASLIPYVIMNATQFMEIYFSTEPVDAIIRNAYIAVLFFNSTLRGVALCLNRSGYEQFMEVIRLLYIEMKVTNKHAHIHAERWFSNFLSFCAAIYWKQSDDLHIRTMLQRTTKTSILVSKINLVMGACSVLRFLMYPLFATTKGRQ